MEKKFSSYETLFVVDLSNGEAAAKALVAKFIDMISANGILTGVNEWGKRRLTYPINDMNEGYYVLANYNAPQSFPAELERVFGITEGIMRSMTTVTAPVEGIAIKYEPKPITETAPEGAAEAADVAAETSAEAPASAEASEEAPAAE